MPVDKPEKRTVNMRHRLRLCQTKTGGSAFTKVLL
jgi:hypothetical protein